MHRFLTILLSAGLAATATLASAAQYRVDSWPADIDKVPCDVWQKKADGTWNQVQPVDAGGLTYWGYWFRNNNYSAILDKKCGG